MHRTTTRREFIRKLGISTAAAPFLLNLPSLGFANQAARKQRIVVMFSPNGVVPSTFWPDEVGADFKLKEILAPLEPFRTQMLTLHGVCDKVRGDGDNHMRGIGCLLTGVELFPGNIQGGSHTPAGWASGISIDQEIKTFWQKQDSTRTRFGSLEFGILVPDRADTWTRMVYAGANRPIAPIDDPYQMFAKLYGRVKDQEMLRSVLDDVQEDLRKISKSVSSEDRRLLDEHAAFVREMERELADAVKRGDSKQEAGQQAVGHEVPPIEPGVKEENDNIPRLSKMQIDLMVNSFAADFARVATLQFTNSVGGARMRWLGVNEGHHELSHKPDDDKPSQEMLTKINRWYCEQLAYLAKRLAETPEPGGGGSL
ncbi:MAG: DUF1552 domain-containing protein, partial [Pirellulales bacterium]